MNQAIVKAAAAQAAPVPAAKRRIRTWTQADFAVTAGAVVLAGIAVEALLAFRAWVQLSGSSLDNILLRLAYWLSTELVAPFKGFETTERSSRILELSTLVAMEAYLLAAVIVLGVLALARAAFEKARAPAAGTATDRSAGAEPTVQTARASSVASRESRVS